MKFVNINLKLFLKFKKINPIIIIAVKTNVRVLLKKRIIFPYNSVHCAAGTQVEFAPSEILSIKTNIPGIKPTKIIPVDINIP